jgi:hypothetical protein
MHVRVEAAAQQLAGQLPARSRGQQSALALQLAAPGDAWQGDATRGRRAQSQADTRQQRPAEIHPHTTPPNHRQETAPAVADGGPPAPTPAETFGLGGLPTTRDAQGIADEIFATFVAQVGPRLGLSAAVSG